jgi:hypothetical protein
LGVQYNDVTGLLVAGVNALLNCVDALKTEAGALQQRISSLEAQRAREAGCPHSPSFPHASSRVVNC